MYLDGVNRGIAFTKAGFYTTGLVVLMGFFATGSGYNGLYLAVGFGLSFLVISGLLSEKNIRPVEFNGISDVIADAGAPFSVSFRLSNASSGWSIFGLESLVLTALPRFRLLDPKIHAEMEARVLVLPPGRTQFVPGRCRGLARGWYREFYVVQRTLFPFGLISKFKVAKFPASVLVLPARDARLEGLLSYEMRQHSEGRDDEQEFHSHRRLTYHEPPHALDWKKNAGRPPEEWLVKTYESPNNEHGFCIEPDWTTIAAEPDEAAYEAAFSAARTACEILHRTGRPMLLKTGAERYVSGYEASVAALATARRFADRSRLLESLPGDGGHAGWFLRLNIARGKHRWDPVPQWIGPLGKAKG